MTFSFPLVQLPPDTHPPLHYHSLLFSPSPPSGFSQRCEDYCDDMWSFDLRDNTWVEIYEIGHFRNNER